VIARERLTRRLVAFWSSTTTGEAVALFRVLLGLLALWTAVNVALNLERFYGPDAIVPWEAVDDFWGSRWSLLALAPDSRNLLVAVCVLAVLSAVLLMLGVTPRLAVLALYVVFLSLHHRNPLILNSGDRLFVMLLGFAMLLPMERRWALWAWPRRRAASPAWGIRLIQVQIAYVYWSSCFSKLVNERWRSGWAISDVLASPVFAEWPAELGLWPWVLPLTWGTLVFEFAFPVLVWFRRMRLWVLAAGVVFHGAIEILMTIPMFGAVMIVSYAVFLEDDDLRRLLSSTARATQPSDERVREPPDVLD
jgi:hypothetical protein